MRRLAWVCLLSGAVAGAWAAVLYLATAWVLALFDLPMAGTVIPGMALGLGLGGLLSPIEDLYNRIWKRALRSALIGAGLGAAAGGVIFLLVNLLSPIWGEDTALLIFLPLLLGICGAIAAMGTSLALGRLRNNLRRYATGGLAGAGLGLVLTSLLIFAPAQSGLFVSGLGLWGALVSFLIFWMEKKLARRWLRVLTAPGEDRFYPLDGRDLTLGKLESNDIPLLYYNEVFPFHCRLKWDADHYKIVDQDQGGVVLVNYRQIQEQDLKHGDLVKLGSALLQYGEAK